MTSATLAPALVLSGSADAPVAAEMRVRLEDRDAILACQRGEREAFDRLVERYQREIYRLCYRYVNNHHDANDMAQEVFLRAYRAISSFRGDSAFATWLYRIAVNSCLNFRSARKAETEQLSESLADAGAGVEDDLAQRERSRLVRDAVKRLPERQRTTLILKVYHDLTHEEVARILGSSVGTVKASLFHALGNLKKLVGAA